MTEKLSNDTLDSAAMYDYKGVTPVGGDHMVCRGNAILETSGDSFLEQREQCGQTNALGERKGQMRFSMILSFMA